VESGERRDERGERREKREEGKVLDPASPTFSKLLSIVTLHSNMLGR
jgi:hypothetical protein